MTPVRERGRASSSTENGTASIGQNSRLIRADSAIGRCADAADVPCARAPEAHSCEGRKKSQSPYEDLDLRRVRSGNRFFGSQLTAEGREAYKSSHG